VPAEPGGAKAEGGFTAIEVVMTTAVLSIVMAMTMAFLVSAQRTVTIADTRSNNVDQARLGVQQLDRQIRSGNLIYNPAGENDPANGIRPGLALRVYTQSNSIQRCVQWRIHDGLLQTRSWTTTWQVDDIVSGWRTVADHIVNDTANPAFNLDPTSSFGSRLLNVSLLVNDSRSASKNAKVEASVAGRNTQYGYPSFVCATIPPYS
jgi:prepilin-type N-terminal cleavage/methylation domain-containing protein